MSHILEFLDLVDTPDTFGASGSILVVNGTGTALEFVTGVNASSIGGSAVGTLAPSDGQVIVFEGVTNDQWEAVTPVWLRKDGDSMTAGDLTLFQNPSNNMHAANKKWIEDNFSAGSHAHDSTYLKLDASNDPMTGTLEWTNAAGPSIMNEAADSTNPTLVPNKADPDTGVGWSTTNILSLVAGGAESLSVAAGTVSIVASDLVLAKAQELQGLDSEGTARSLVSLNDSTNVVYFGDIHNSAVISVLDTLTITGGDVLLDNNETYQGKLVGGTVVGFAGINTSDQVQLGNSSYPLDLIGTKTVAFPALVNAVALQWRDATDTGTITALTVNSSNGVDVGTTSFLTTLKGTYIVADGDIRVTTGDAIQFQNVSETWLDALSVTSSVLYLGSSFASIVIDDPISANVVLNNAIVLQGKEVGGTARNLILLNDSDEVEVGSSSVELNFMGTQIDAVPILTCDLVFKDSAGPTILNEAATATNPTLIPNRADPDTGVGWGTTNEATLIAGGTEVVRVAGGTVTVTASNVVLSNAKAIQGKTTSAAVRELIGVDSSDIVEVGSTFLATLINGTSVTSNTDIRVDGANAYQLNLGGTSGVFSDALSVDSTGSDFVVLGNTSYETKIKTSGGVILDNAKALQGTALITGTFYDLIQLNASNEVAVGNTSVALNLLGTQIDSITALANTVYLQAEESGGTARNLIGMDSSNDVAVGSTSNTLDLKCTDYVTLDNMGVVRVGNISGGNYTDISGTAGSLYQYGTSIVDTENYVTADEGVRSKLFETNKVQTLANDTAVNPFTWNATTTGDHIFVMIPYSFFCSYTESSTTKYFQQSGVYYWMGFHDGTNINLTSMSGSIPTPVTVNTGTGTVAVTINAGADGTPPKGPNWKIAVSGTGTFVSGNVQYCVISCDSDHRGFNTL